MSGKSIEKRKTKINEINNNLEKKAQELQGLEQRYDQAFDARMQLESMELDDETLTEIRSENTERMNDLKDEGERLSETMNEENQELNEIREENQESQQEIEKAKSHAGIFDRMTGGKVTEKLDQNAKQLEGIQSEINESQKKLDELSSRASNLNTHRSRSF